MKNWQTRRKESKKMTDVSPEKSRELIKSIIEARYTAPD